MRIALLQLDGGDPDNELPVAGLRDALAARGHDVVLIRSPGPRARDGFRDAGTVWLPNLQVPRVARHYEDHLALSPFICWEIMRRDLNVVHAFQSAGAWAATMAIRGKSPSLVFSLQRTPDRRFLTARHFRLEMLLRVAEKAAACTVPDIEASRTFERYLLRHPEVADTVGDLEVAKIAERFEQIYRASGGGT